jgi:hypothetical protein
VVIGGAAVHLLDLELYTCTTSIPELKQTCPDPCLLSLPHTVAQCKGWLGHGGPTSHVSKYSPVSVTPPQASAESPSVLHASTSHEQLQVLLKQT